MSRAARGPKIQRSEESFVHGQCEVTLAPLFQKSHLQGVAMDIKNQISNREEDDKAMSQETFVTVLSVVGTDKPAGLLCHP